MSDKGYWLLTLKDGSKIRALKEEWNEARKMTPWYQNEADLEYRCRAWTVYTATRRRAAYDGQRPRPFRGGKVVTDYEWIDE